MTCIVYLQFVGIDIVDAIFLLYILAKEGESSAQDSYLVTIFLQDIHEAVDSFGEGEILGYVSHYADIESLEQLASLREALLEVYLSSHGALRYGSHLFIDTMLASQFVYDLCLYEG